jgi:hypothetical protein
MYEEEMMTLIWEWKVEKKKMVIMIGDGDAK